MESLKQRYYCCCIYV